jgi:predicted Zn-dependent protease
LQLFGARFLGDGATDTAMRYSRQSLRLLFVLALVFTLAAPALAQQRRPISLIRDAEIENTIQAFAAPLLRAAAIPADSVHVYIVNDDALNAFVAGGMNLFIHTGLIQKASGPEGLIGVMAHEIGHIAGGHLIRAPGALENVGLEAMISYILGAAVMVAGAGAAGSAIIATGSGIAQRSLFQYSRTQEQSADQAGMRYLEATGQSARGLLDTFEVLKKQELLAVSRQSPYLRTHPLTDDRIAFVRNAMEASPYSDAPTSPEYLDMFDRLVAKLDGFLNPPGHTLTKYPESDDSEWAQYARAVAYHKLADVPRALAALEPLLAAHPDDPYFYELKGQILFENGRIFEAIPAYEQAVRLLPDEPLLRIGLAQAQIETNDPALNAVALQHLLHAVLSERTSAGAWRYLGIAYGRAGEFGQSSLALAEEALLRGNKDDVLFHVQRAEQALPEGSPGWLRLQDLKRVSEDMKS